MICQTQTDLPTDMGYFAYLPPELVNEVINYFPISDINALHQTGKNLNPVVATALFAKTQKHLEQLESQLLEVKNLRIDSNPMNNRYYSLFKDESEKSTKNGSEARCIALRERVCRIFWDMTLNEIFPIMDLHPSEDPLLLSKIIKSHATFTQYLKITKENDKDLALFLKMLGGNALRVSILKLCIHPLYETTATLFAKALRENTSITDLFFEYPFCYPKYFKEVMDAVKENEQILYFKFKVIGEPDWHIIKDKTHSHNIL